MPIQVEFSDKEDLSYPIIVCKVCKERITDARYALFFWPDAANYAEESKPWRAKGIEFAHEACRDGMNPELDSAPLEQFAIQLLFQLGQTQEAEAAMKALKRKQRSTT